MSLRARGNMSLRQTRLDTLRWLTVTQHTRSNSDVTFLWQIEGVLNICLKIFKSWLYRRDDPTSNLLKIWVTSRHSGEIEPIFVCLFVCLSVCLFYLFTYFVSRCCVYAFLESPERDEGKCRIFQTLFWLRNLHIPLWHNLYPGLFRGERVECRSQC